MKTAFHRRIIMAKYIILLLGFMTSCQTFPEKGTQYTRKTVISDLHGKTLRQSHELLILGKKSFEILSYDANGKLQNRWLTKYDADEVIHYDNSVLHSITKRDRSSGCESTKRYAKDLISDFVTCNGREVQATHIAKNGTTNRKCEQNKHLYTCVTTQFAKPPSRDSETTVGNAVIFANDLFVHDGEQTYYMQVIKHISDGRQIELFEMDLPIGSAIPLVTDTRWKLHRTEKMVNFVNALNLYSSVKIIDTDENTIETQTIMPN